MTKEQNGGNSGRFDLALRPTVKGTRRRPHCYYHRLVALSLLKCHWDEDGCLLSAPYAVSLGTMHLHEVHHLAGFSVCSLKHLAVVPTVLHKKLESGEVEQLLRPTGGVAMNEAET